MKYEWKKIDKQLYLPDETPVIVEVPKMKYFVIDGKGNPNTSSQFQEDLQALYSVSYGVKMFPKSGVVPENYYEYTVFPLEGIWDMGSKPEDLSNLNKEDFIYSLMIRQPDFVNDKLASEVIEKSKQRKKLKALDKIRFVEIEDGLCVQMLHLGSYDDELKSFVKMNEFCLKNDLKRKGHNHREIYLSDPRRVEVSKLRTVLRMFVERSNN